MSEMRRPLVMNTERGGMKRIMEEAARQHVEAMHYSALAGISRRREEHWLRKRNCIMASGVGRLLREEVEERKIARRGDFRR